VKPAFQNKSLHLLFILLLCLLWQGLAARDYVRSLKSPQKFSGIECVDAFNINIHKGKVYEAKVYGSMEDVQKVLMRVEDGQLMIKFIRTPFIGLQFTNILRVEVTLPELESVVMSGSGTISVKDKFECAKLSVSLAGSGLISIPTINCNNADIEIGGSGTIRVGGYCSKMDLTIAGSGNFSGEKFNVDSADVTIAGSGEVVTFVSRTLDATVSGSGSIYYLGKPTVNRVITGSGDIAPLKPGK
jgi:hypothetical protein